MAATESIEMDLPEDLREIIEDLQDSANARAIFGEPVERDGRTVVPVARVAYGFGGGFGAGPGLGEAAEAGEEGDAGVTIEAVEDLEDEGGSGAGFGGGLSAKPVGALEITDHDTRFVPIASNRDRLLALLGLGVGLFLGRLLGRRAGRKAARRALEADEE